MGLLHAAVLRLLPLIPRPVIHRVARRYIAGESLDELMTAVQRLHARGLFSTVDVLGENVDSIEAAESATAEYLRVVERLSETSLPSQVSVKLSLVGLRVSEALAADAALRIAAHAERHRISMCLDMEDSSTTDATLRTFRFVRERHEDVGIALQAYLRRSLTDLEHLLDLRPAVRICKGIYVEPESISYKNRQAIRENYLRLLQILVEGRGYPAIATHDPWLVDRALSVLKAKAVARDQHEFQMLLGVGEGLRPRILRAGSRLRLYCPFGPDWHAYSLRRLRENPRMLTYVLKGLFNLGRRTVHR